MDQLTQITWSLKDRLRQIPSLQPPLPDMDLDAMPTMPHDAFALWLEGALAEGVRESHAMTLSTVDEQGWPDARVLILKNVDARGWHFAINSESPKARQIKQQPKVSLTFYWPALGRQIRLRGEAIVLSEQECAEDFMGRPIGSRISAIASRQSEILDHPDELTQRLDEARTFLHAHPDHIKAGWCVYAVAPTVVEFWQGASDRNHKRLIYNLSSDGAVWSKAHLWP